VEQATEQQSVVKEYARRAQIEFFDRLRSGDDPVHEEARTELMTLVDNTLELLYSLRVARADHDAEVRRILTKLDVIAGNEVDVFTLDVSTAGYDVSDPELMNDLKDEVKARFDEDEKLVLALLAEPGVNLDEVDNNLGCVGHHRYSFSTFDPVIAEKYGFLTEEEREAEVAEVRAAQAARNAEPVVWPEIADGDVRAAVADLAKAKGERAALAIYTVVKNIANDPAKQAALLLKVVGA
jgi:hypothetical protein